MGNDARHVFSRSEIDRILGACVGKTLGEVDSSGVFERAVGKPKVTGIAGDVVEQSVIGYPANPDQEPDLVVDSLEVELKTTGLKRLKTREGLFAKEPMSITAVSISTIAAETFEASAFWHKVERMLIVYYLYDSDTTVAAGGYAAFPIKGYQFHIFEGDEAETLRRDWELVRGFIANIQSTCPDEESRRERYPQLSSALRPHLMLIDTAPKYPNKPRFRLKQATVTAIARKAFGDGYEQLPQAYRTMGDVDARVHEVAEKFTGRTLGQLASALGIGRVTKGTAERVAVAMFGGKSGRMADIELFAKVGLKAKSVVLTRDGKRTEDMKLMPLDFDELSDPEASFDESAMRAYFAEGSILCIVLEEPCGAAPLSENRLLGFKRISFDDGFIEQEVAGTFRELVALVAGGGLRLVPQIDRRTGLPKVNATGEPVAAPNLPKSRDHTVFVRGTGRDSRDKPVEVNGIRMYRQQLWIKGSYIAERLREEDWI